MAFTTNVTFEDNTTLVNGYRLSALAIYIKKHHSRNERKLIPILPWLIDIAFENIVNEQRRKSIKRIDIKEKVIL